MYDKIPLILAAVMGIMGLLCVIVPKSATKKENRESEEAVRKTRIYGIVLTVIAIVLFVVGFISK